MATQQAQEVKAQILIVDDDFADAEARKVTFSDFADVTAREPTSVEPSDVDKADVILMDYRLENWPARDQTAIFALRAEDGLAVNSVLRSYRRAKGEVRPIAFVLQSGRLQDLAGDRPVNGREHILAREFAVDWIVSKAGEVAAAQIKSICQAVLVLGDIPAIEHTRDAPDVLFKLLGLHGDAAWAALAWRDVEELKAPLEELVGSRDRSAFLRWLLQEVFPFPGVLLDEVDVAVKLRLQPAAFKEAVLGADAKCLNSYIYSGLLAGFSGKRWWRAGIDDFLWTITEGRPFDASALRKANLAQFPKVAEIEMAHPVRLVDSEFRVTDQIAEIADAVQIRPDDWPPAIEHPWISIRDIVQDPDLTALVIPRDRDRVNRARE